MMKNYSKIYREKISQVEVKRRAAESAHRSRMTEIETQHKTRIEEFQEATKLRTEKRASRLREEIGLREALSELQATNQEYIPKFIAHLIEWEAYFNSLREKQASESGPAQPPAPIE